VSLLPFVMRAVVVAVQRHPAMNARFDDEEGVVHRHRAIHLGIAVQTDRGLMVPVVKRADTLDIWASAAEVARLAAAARAAKITLDELSGSTITITSLGALGGIASTPVINAPEVAIIGVNKIVDRPVYRDDALVRRQIMNLSSSFDHRVIDGADAAAFIRDVRRLLESPALLFVSTP
jgi:2-oxoisovalerate dehydrogenase E2 component (dihydrolipoyl transacylase)